MSDTPAAVQRLKAQERLRHRASWRDRFAALRSLPPLLRLVREAAPSHLVLGLLLRLVNALIPISMLWVSKLILDKVVAVVSRGRREEMDGLWLLFALEFALAGAAELLARLVQFIDARLALRFTDHANIRIMEHACSLDLATLEDPEFHDKLERARNQVGMRVGMLGLLGTTVQNLVTFASYAVGVLSFSGMLFALLTLSVIPVFVGEVHFAALAYVMAMQQTPQRRELDYLRYLGASQQSAKEVRVFGLGRYLVARYRALAERFAAAQLRIDARRTGIGAGLGMLGAAGYYLAYGMVLQRALSGGLSVGEMTFLAGTFLRSRSCLQATFSSVAGLADQALFVRDLFDFFEVEPRVLSPVGGVPAPRPIARGFEFRNVSFQYAGSGTTVLRNIDLRIEPGECVAVVGDNGAGKTTLVKLLARLYDPSSGVILLDGVDLREYDLGDLREQVGIIFQDYVRFEMLVRENIGLGRVEHVDDLPRVKDAAARGVAAELIASLPRGYDQMLGRRFDNGIELSGGQWQKIALSRAYMRDPQVLILDEPTASLDARAEYDVFRCFADLKSDRTTLLISHRFSTVRMANRILVLDRGEIREQGTHGELLDLDGHYAELFHLQADGYR